MKQIKKHFNFAQISRSLGKDRTTITRDGIPLKFYHRFEVLFEFMEEWIKETKRYDKTKGN